MPPGVDMFWGTPTSTLDWCERNYEISPVFAEFWNTMSNLGMIVPSICGIFDILIKNRLENKFILSFLSLILVGLGSWAFHMTLLYPMQLVDELPMVWGNCIPIYHLWEVRKPMKRQINWNILLVCFTYCFFFTAAYLIFKNPLIHQVMYGISVFVILGLDLRLVNYNQCRTCTKLLSTGFFLFTFGFGVWNIDNQLCDMLTDVRRIIPPYCRPLTQLHAWWHLLAGYATYLHIIFTIHTRSHFVKPKTESCVRWYGIALRRVEPSELVAAVEKLH